mmetsp:Transcript_13114/g.15280  ORF Transcript_13114/g.15280 Transcript_13114/m.15280 type:complete len:269 (-) Transcript_13114:116-922(-)
MSTMLPALFLSHGGGPLPLLGHKGHENLTASLKQVQNTARIDVEKVKCILVVSAHWMEETIKVSTNPEPNMIFDYYGFPDSSYKYKYPAKGSPETAEAVLRLLKEAGIEAKEDKNRGFDHGVFVPLMLAFPEANIPVVSMSLKAGLSEEFHVEVGKALEPLRKNVLIVGSGMSYHNMRGFDPSYSEKSKMFSKCLKDACVGTNGKENGKRERLSLLVNWKNMDYASICHPVSEHLVPLFVAAAAGGKSGKVLLDDKVLDVQVNAFSFQ